MVPELRAAFNAAYETARYEAYCADLERRVGIPIGFRLAETPVFLPGYFRERCLRAGREIVAQLSEPAFVERMRAAVPERFAGPHPAVLPNVACVDFAIVRAADGSFEPKLIELQGFPSLLAFEALQADAWEAALDTMPGCDRKWSASFCGDRADFFTLLRETIVGDHDPEAVVLLDLDPATQKTACDFAATKRLFDVDAVDPDELSPRGRKLYRTLSDGRERAVERIYYRMVPDELERTGRTLPFPFPGDLDVEWVPHPNWFWMWSKYSLPHLAHPALPATRLLSEVEELPPDLESNFVLKPLFSFAGAGVNVHPRAADVQAIDPSARDGWCLQEKIAYAEAFEAADGGGVKVEMRMMFLRPDNASELVPAINLCRLSRGDLLGVDFNKNKTWVGSSIGIWTD